MEAPLRISTPTLFAAAALGLALAAPGLAQDAEEAPTEDAAPVEEAAEAAGPTTYALDASKSWLYVQIYNDDDRWTPVQGHDHAIKATSFDGTVVWNPDDPSACDIQISFPVTALAVDPPGMRERAGLSAEGAVGDGQKKTIVGNMLGKSQLEASSFPKISYRSSACAASGSKVDVTGTLTIHGVGKQVTVPMSIEADGSSFSAKGSFRLSHEDFGMKPFTYGPATPKNESKLDFVVDVVGSPKG